MQKRDIRAIGFDFDDTLIFSEDKKVKIFQAIFSQEYHKTWGVKSTYLSLRGKANREEKIAFMIEKLLRKPATKQEIARISKLFSQKYQEELANCPLVQCTQLLKELKQQVQFMFLLSLEEKADVAMVAKHCGVSKYFNEILGGPKSKKANFMHVLNKHKIKPSETMYIGDSRGDVVTSSMFHIKMIGVNKKFSYRKMLDELGAVFTFSNLCKVPFKKILKK